MGREGRDETGEELAPEKGDNDVLGASIMWTSREEHVPVAFSAPWAEPHARGIAAVQGEWNWECGLHRDMTTEVESIRDHMLCVIYGSFSLAKRKEANARRVIDFCPYLLAKRESRRLLGDHILTGEEIAATVPFEDAVATGSWSIDLHYDDVQPGVDFLTRCDQRQVRPYWIPYRSLYSRNVPNLFMAGRCLSATHVGLGSPRVMNTLAQTGVAVGEAAAICGREGILPRGIWSERRIVELQDAIGGDWPGRPAPEHVGWAYVDDEDEGVVFNGKGWLNRWGVHGGITGLHARGYDCRQAPPGTAVYPLPVKEPGRYRLRFRVPRRLQRERTSIVAALVESAGSGTKVSWDTSICSGEWNLIGEYDLVPGAKLVLLPSESTGEFMTDAYSVEKISERGAMQ